VKVQWRHTEWECIPEQIGPGENDVALIKVPTTEHPCVLLAAAAEPSDRVWTQGYVTKQGEIRLEPAMGEIEGERRARLEAGGPEFTLLKFKGGQIVPGMSGAPLLNFRSRGVCGIVAKTLNEATDAGGLAVPLRTLLACYPFLAEQQSEYHRAHPDWRLSGLVEPSSDLTHEEKIEIVGSFPPGPAVSHAVIPRDIITAFYNLTENQCVEIVLSANSIRIEIEPKINYLTITLNGLPNPSFSGIVTYWLSVFTQAAARGPRMLAAVIYEAPPYIFAGNEQKVLKLLATLRTWPIS
jgi:hypothetical protein